METQIFRNDGTFKAEQVLEKFTRALENVPEYKQSEIEELADIYAKNPTDVFIVHSEDLDSLAFQGDISIWSEKCEDYKKNIGTVKLGELAKNMNLQDGDAITGDHRVVPLKGSKLTITDGTFKISFMQRSINYGCKLVESDKPFLITHREHGNIALPSGKYMMSVLLNPNDLRRVID